MNLPTTTLWITCCLLLAGCGLSAQEASSRGALETQAAQSLAEGDYAAAIQSLQNLSKIEPQNLSYELRLADAWFMNGQMPQAIASYQRAVKVDSDLGPQCWQLGLAFYFAGKFEQGKQQLESHQTVNRQDVENSVWHLLCNAELIGLQQARKQMIPIQGDQRVPMPEVYELFAGRGSVQAVLQAARNTPSNSPRTRDTYMYYAHLYTGLFHQMLGEADRAREAMKQASQINPLSKAQLMGSIADVYLKLHDPENRN